MDPRGYPVYVVNSRPGSAAGSFAPQPMPSPAPAIFEQPYVVYGSSTAPPTPGGGGVFYPHQQPPQPIYHQQALPNGGRYIIGPNPRHSGPPSYVAYSMHSGIHSMPTTPVQTSHHTRRDNSFVSLESTPLAGDLNRSLSTPQSAPYPGVQLLRRAPSSERVERLNGIRERGDVPSEKHRFEVEGGHNTVMRHAREEQLKTVLCNSFSRLGMCPYGNDCRYAHGEHELRPRASFAEAAARRKSLDLSEQYSRFVHPKFKTQLCEKFSINGHCPYRTRCQFIHMLKKGLPIREYEALLKTGSISPEKPEESRRRASFDVNKTLQLAQEQEQTHSDRIVDDYGSVLRRHVSKQEKASEKSTERRLSAHLPPSGDRRTTSSTNLRRYENASTTSDDDDDNHKEDQPRRSRKMKLKPRGEFPFVRLSFINEEPLEESLARLELERNGGGRFMNKNSSRLSNNLNTSGITGTKLIQMMKDKTLGQVPEEEDEENTPQEEKRKSGGGRWEHLGRFAPSTRHHGARPQRPLHASFDANFLSTNNKRRST